jgi:hypothetical protein
MVFFLKKIVLGARAEADPVVRLSLLKKRKRPLIATIPAISGQDTRV